MKPTIGKGTELSIGTVQKILTTGVVVKTKDKGKRKTYSFAHIESVWKDQNAQDHQ